VGEVRRVPESDVPDRREVEAALALVNRRPSVEPIGLVRYGKGPYATWTRAFLQRMGKSPRKAKGSFAVSDVETIVSQVLVMVAKGSGPLGTGQAQEIVRLTGLSEGLTVGFLVDLTAKNRASGALFERLKDLAATAGAMESAGMLDDVPPLIAVLNGMGQVVAAATQLGQVERLRALDAILAGIEHNMRSGAVVNEVARQAAADGPPELGLVFDSGEPSAVPEREAVVRPPPPPARKDPVSGLDLAAREVEALVGMAEVKREFATLVDKARVMAVRKEVGLAPYKVARHFAFVGNPGTGKATVAALLSRVYGDLGLLSKGHLCEVAAPDLVDLSGPGLTPARTRLAMEPARGGILLVGDPDRLGGPELGDAGQEAIDALARVMRDSRCDLVVVLAGGDAAMRAFLAATPRIAAHVPQTIAFADPDLRGMVTILASFARTARCEFEPAASRKLLEVMGRIVAERGEGYDNAGRARRLFDAIVSVRAARMAADDGARAAGSPVTADDVSAAWVALRLG
jgi:hypothetical protein